MAYLNQQLKTAIEKQDEDAMEQLLECGADPNAFLSGEDIAPIHLGPGISKSITALLLKYGGDPNLRTSDGITPLHIAATWGNKSIVKLLLHSGANVYIRDDEGFTPLDMAKKYEHEKCEIILKQHLHILESQMNNKQKVRQKPPINTKTNSKRVIDNSRNVDANQNFSLDPEYQSSRIKQKNPRHSIYRKEIQNQIDHLCENEEDFHLDVTSPDHPCINVTPKRQYHFSSPKHIRAYSEPVTENTSTPIRPRRSLYTTSMQHKIDRLTGSGKNVGIDVTSPDHPELFFTPTAKSPLNYHEKIYSETPINSHKTNVMISKSPESSSSESDLYVTVNEASVDHRNKEIPNILNVDEMKHSMTHKIEQLRNCLNKLDTQKPFITDEDKQYCRSKEPYSNKDFSSGKQKNRKAHGQNPDVDVKFTMELPPKMVLDEKKIKKIEHSKPYTIEMNLGQKYKKSQGKNSKREPVIDIQIQPKGESPMKYKVRNQDEADIQINSKGKVDLKSPEIQEKHNSRVRSKSAHENICFQAEQDSKLRGKNMNGRHRQETYPGERISTVNLTHKNQRGGERYDYNDVIDPSVLITHDSRNHIKSNGHSKKGYVIRSSTENVPPNSYSHVTSRNYKSKLPFQKQELSHCSNMTEEKMITRSHVQHNERASNFSRERKIIPEKSSYTSCRKEPLIFPTQKNPQPIKRKDLSHPQQKTVFLKESSESKYLNCNSIPKNHFFRQKGCMVINEKPKVDAVQKIVSQKVVHASLDKRATKLPDCDVHAESFLLNTDSQKAQFSNKSRHSTSSATSTDTYYTCSSQLDTDDFFSCENGQESSSEDHLAFPTDADKRPVPSFFEELTEVLGSKDSSYLREFEFNENELIHALSEFNLREPNTSAVTETLFNALSSIRKSNDKEMESSDQSLVATNQFRNTQSEKSKQDNTLCKTGSLLHHASAIDRDNSHIRRQARITAKSSLPCESLNATDGQYEEFETAIEEVLLSRSASKFKSQFSNPIMSESNSLLQTSSVSNHSAAVSPTSLKSESNTSDTFFLVCVPSADNKFDTPQYSAHISSRDEVDHQSARSLHHERDENNSLNPVKPDLFHSCIDNENMRSKIQDGNSPYASNFSKVLSELKQKTDVKALQSQKKTCYRWQPPENVMSSSYTDDSFLNGNERDPKSKELKKRVGLELKNHPLVKSQKSAIEKSFDYHEHSAQDEDLHTKQNEHSRLDADLEDEFNETRLKHILMEKDLDNCRQPQIKKPNSLRQNISKQKSFSKYDTTQIPHFKSVQNECMKICKQPNTRKISEKNQSYYAGFDASYNPSQRKDDSVFHSCYHSLKKASGNSKEAGDSDDSLELEKSCYTSLQKEGSTDMGQSQYVSYCRDKSLDTDRSRYTSFHRKGSSEVDQSCYTSVHREVSPHMDQSRYFSSRQENYHDADRSYTSIDSEDFSDADKSHYVSVRRDDFPDADKSHYVSVRRDDFPDADKSHYVSVRRDDFPDADKSHYVSVRRDDFPDADKSHYVSVRRDDFPDADKSHYVSVRRDDFPDADKSHYVSVCRDDISDADKSHYVSVRRDDFPDADKSHYVSVRKDDFPDADKSHYVSVRRDDFPDADKSHYVSVRRDDFPDADKSHYVSVCRDDISDADKSHYVSVRRDDFPDADKSHYVSVRRDDFPDADKSHYVSVRRDDFPDADKSHYVSVCRDDISDADKSHYVSVRRDDFPDADKSHYVSVRRDDFPDADKSHYVSVRRDDFPDADKSHYVSVCRDDISDADKSHYVSVRRDDFPDADKSHYVSVRRDDFPDADKSHYVSVRRDDFPDADKSHYVSVRRDDFPDADKSHYVSVRRDDFPDADKSHYVSVRRDDFPDADKSHYVSVRRDDFPDADKSHYVSVRRDDFPDADKSHYVSVCRDDFPDADKSHYVSVCRDNISDADRSHYVSVRRDDLPDANKSHYFSANREDIVDADTHCVSIHKKDIPNAEKSHYISVQTEDSSDADKSHYVSVHGENIPDTDKSHYVSVCREGSLEINPSSSAFNHKKSIPVNFKALSTKSSRIPTLINGQLQKQQKVNDFISNTEHVTLQKRYISPPPSCQNDKSLYVSAEEKDSFFTHNERSKSNVESVGDNVTSSSHWQYLSTKSSAHNRSVTWQNPISTFDQIDAALVDSTDESISWSPKQKGHSPQTIPLTSTSASEEITSESMSSDEFKRCLERKKLLTPEERTTLWVNGIYKSNLQEYFDADMSSILPVLNSNTSSSDTGKEMKCGATAANMTNHRYIEPSAPPQSEINCDNFRCIPTAPPDISNIAVAGTFGDKVNELSSSDYVSLHPSLYPSLVEPCQNSVSKMYSGSQCKGNNSELHAASTSAAYVSFDSEPEPTANVHCSPQTIQNTPRFTGKMSSVKPVPFQDASNKSYLMGINTVNKLHKTAKSISTQTPVLRIPPDPPNKSKSLPVAFGMTTQNKKLKEKLPQKRWAKLKKIFTGKKIQGKIGNKAFISVDSRQSFLPNLSELSPPSTDTSGTQTDPDIFYEPTLKHLEFIKSDEVSLSVNFSENLSDYSEKYPSSVLPNMAEYLEQATRIDSLEICSSSGATSGSMERLLSPYREDSNEDDDIDEVDHVASNTYPVNSCDNQEFKDNSQPLSTETKIYGETYKTKLAQGDKRRKSNNIEFLHTDPEERVQFIERQISAENQNGDQSDDSESTEIYDWKSFSKSFNDDCDNLPQTENRSFYWRTCGDKPDDVKTNVKKSKKPLTDLGCLSDVQFRQTLIDHGLSNPGPVTKGTRQLYLKRLKNQSGQQTLACTQSSPDYNAELCRAFNEQIDWTEMVELEEKMIKKFDNSKNSQKWREGNEKSSFTYLLLDPRVTRNLPRRASKMDDTLETFRTFVKAIFYIGKGKRSRPYAHLYEAIKYSQGNSTKINEKISHITDIWKNGYGVVSLHCFQNVIPVEAYSREACMVDAIGCSNLTNKKRGDFYGLTSTWCLKLKRRMGVYFLHKALRIFMAEGERQIYLTDL